jgi:hypothetical protein
LLIGQQPPSLSIPAALPQGQAGNGSLSSFSMPAMQGMGLGGGFNNSIYENLMYSNLMLSNWLGSVKSNNNSLYDGMINHSLVDQLMHKNNLERYIQAEQQQKMMEMGRLPLQNEEQQSIVCLIQQIGLYKELLSQVTYQNQLLSRDITYKQQQNAMNSLSQLKYPNDLSQFSSNMQNLQGMQGMNFLGGMNNPLGSMATAMPNSMGNSNMNMNSSLSGMPNNMGMGLSNLQGLSGLGLSGMGAGLMGSNILHNADGMLGNQVTLNNLINQNRSAENAKEKEANAPPTNPAMLPMGAMGMSGLGSNYDLIKSMIL